MIPPLEGKASEKREESRMASCFVEFVYERSPSNVKGVQVEAYDLQVEGNPSSYVFRNSSDRAIAAFPVERVISTTPLEED